MYTVTCKRCKKSLSIEQLDREYNICLTCAAEKRFRIYKDLLNEEKNLNGFLRLEQFIFIIVCLFFTVKRLFNNDIFESMRENVFFEHPVFWGAVAIAGMTFIYILIFSRKQKIIEIDDKIWSFITTPTS